MCPSAYRALPCKIECRFDLVGIRFPTIPIRPDIRSLYILLVPGLCYVYTVETHGYRDESAWAPPIFVTPIIVRTRATSSLGI